MYHAFGNEMYELHSYSDQMGKYKLEFTENSSAQINTSSMIPPQNHRNAGLEWTSTNQLVQPLHCGTISNEICGQVNKTSTRSLSRKKVSIITNSLTPKEDPEGDLLKTKPQYIS